MSHQNDYSNETAHVDVPTVSSHDAERTNVVPVDVARPPTLPTGEVIDCKNTLQSFCVQGPPEAVAAPPVVGLGLVQHPTLPDGQVITGKNTLQSFPDDNNGRRPAIQRMPGMDSLSNHRPEGERKRSRENDQPRPSETTTPLPATVVAVAVGSEIVLSEFAPGETVVSPTNSMDRDVAQNIIATDPLTPWYKTQYALIWLTIILVFVLIALGLSIGLTSADGSSSSKNQSSSSPTLAPIAIDPNIIIRASVLTSYINNITLSDQIIASTGTSPESKALSWLIYNDTTLVTAAVVSQDDPIARNAVGFRIRQRYSLLVMWFQQTDAVEWAITTGWLVEESECAWAGITCSNVFVDYFIDDNDDVFEGGSQNAVTQISFKLLSSYTGTIPEEIGLLSSLQHFEIINTNGDGVERNRYLQGPLPDSIGQWTALTHFDVSNNDLTGTLPDSIGQWYSLTFFSASVNDFTGTIPFSIGNWTLIEAADFSLNHFVGTMPDAICEYIVDPVTGRAEDFHIDCAVSCNCCTTCFDTF